jgi:TolB protein
MPSTKRRWLKEFGQIAAGALVLMLVVGLLAVLFQDRHDQPGTTGSQAGKQQLPMTITANGIAITLETVEVSNTAMRFTFRVQLPPDAVNSTEPFILGPLQLGNLQVEGLTDGPITTVSGGGEHHVGERSTTLTVMLNPFAQPREAVSITIRQLYVNLTPNATHVINGPWRFELPRTFQSSVPYPAPDSSGIYTNLSVAQAQQLVGFPIIEPTPLPGFLYPQLFNAKAAAHGSTNPNWLQLTYTVKNEAANAIIVEESTEPPDDISNASSETTIEIDGVTVTKRELTQVTGRSVFYTWQLAGTSFKLTADLSWQVTEPVLEQMVSSMIDQPANALSPATGSKSLRGTIIFTSSRSGNDEIYAINPDGTGLRQLTNDPKMDFAPIWSPDGSKIAFMRMQAIPNEAIPPDARPPISIYVMNADGSEQRNLTPEGSRSFRNLVWSPDSKQLAVECTEKSTDRSGDGQICVLNIDGTGMRRVVPAELTGQAPVWSPDGRWIAFRGQAQGEGLHVGLYLVSPDGSQQRTVRSDIAVSGTFAWSPDSRELVYVSEPHVLTMIDIDGSNTRNLDTGDRIPSNPTWSPDGSRLIFEWQAPGHSFSGLAVINADGSGLRDLAPVSDDVSSATWSPDGQAIAVVRGFPNHSMATPGVEELQSALELRVLDGSPPRTLVEENTATDGSGLLDSLPSWQPVH